MLQSELKKISCVSKRDFAQQVYGIYTLTSRRKMLQGAANFRCCSVFLNEIYKTSHTNFYHKLFRLAASTQAVQ